MRKLGKAAWELIVEAFSSAPIDTDKDCPDWGGEIDGDA